MTLLIIITESALQAVRMGSLDECVAAGHFFAGLARVPCIVIGDVV